LVVDHRFNGLLSIDDDLIGFRFNRLRLVLLLLVLLLPLALFLILLRVLDLDRSHDVRHRLVDWIEVRGER